MRYLICALFVEKIALYYAFIYYALYYVYSANTCMKWNFFKDGVNCILWKEIV